MDLKRSPLAALASSLVLLVALPALADASSAKIFKIVGDVTYNKGVRATEGATVQQGAVVQTGRNSSAVLLFDNGATVTLSPDTKLTISRYRSTSPGGSGLAMATLATEPGTSQTKLRLNYGEVVGSVKSLSPKSKFDIDTLVGNAGIRGTTFRVSVTTLPNGGWRVTFSIADGQGEFTSTGAAPVPVLSSKEITATLEGGQLSVDPVQDMPPATRQIIDEAVRQANDALGATTFPPARRPAATPTGEATISEIVVEQPNVTGLQGDVKIK